MIKEVKEDSDGNISFVGTFIHHQVGTFSDAHLFRFRFNEQQMAPEDVTVRGTTFLQGFGTRTTCVKPTPLV